MNGPDFIIAGMTKSASTSLNHLLREHNQVAMPSGEVHFFDRHFKRGITYYEKLLRTEGKSSQGKLLGDTTPGYAKSEEVAERISQTVPHVKLVFCLRNPCDRMFSSYLHSFKKAREDRSFEVLIKEEMSKLGKRKPKKLDNADYDLKLQPFLDRFPRENIFITFFEHLTGKDQSKEIDRLTDFLEIIRFENPALPWDNKTSVPMGLQILRIINAIPGGHLIAGKASWNLPEVKNKPKMAPETRKMLEAHFAPMSERLDKLLAIDSQSVWKMKK